MSAKQRQFTTWHKRRFRNLNLTSVESRYVEVSQKHFYFSRVVVTTHLIKFQTFSWLTTFLKIKKAVKNIYCSNKPHKIVSFLYHCYFHYPFLYIVLILSLSIIFIKTMSLLLSYRTIKHSTCVSRKVLFQNKFVWMKGRIFEYLPDFLKRFLVKCVTTDLARKWSFIKIIYVQWIFQG